MRWLRGLTGRERAMGVALITAMGAIVVVPAWGSADGAETDDPADVEEALAPDGERQLDPLGDCLRRHGAPLPAERPEGDELPAPIPREDFDADFDRAAAECGLPEPPPGTDPFPLSDEQIREERAALEKFADCMASRGLEVGPIEVEQDRIWIGRGDDPFSEEYLAAQEVCGGLPVPPSG